MKKCFIAIIASGVLVVGMLVAGCNKKDDSFSSIALEDYMKLETGKYIIYRYDSLEFTNYGQKDTIVSYQARDLVEGTATDNLGRNGWRIVRSIRAINSTSDNEWKPFMTYFVIASRAQIEVSESSFRYIKLTSPVTDGRSWRGNGYLPDNPYQDLYDFSNDEDMQKWDYTYQDVGASLTLNNKTYDSTITVLQIADSTNLPIQVSVPASKSYWVEKYAKGIGLVYKEVELWEYQPPTNVAGYRHGFGVKMTIIDHN
jgi:hypothetical protein